MKKMTIIALLMLSAVLALVSMDLTAKKATIPEMVDNTLSNLMSWTMPMEWTAPVRATHEFTLHDINGRKTKTGTTEGYVISTPAVSKEKDMLTKIMYAENSPLLNSGWTEDIYNAADGTTGGIRTFTRTDGEITRVLIITRGSGMLKVFYSDKI